jgi:hypothetical protein
METSIVLPPPTIKELKKCAHIRFEQMTEEERAWWYARYIEREKHKIYLPEGKYDIKTLERIIEQMKASERPGLKYDHTGIHY